mgnify:CR=1 FL=1|nr:hypothetical protein [uncultured Dongia sp.]
MMRTTRTTVLFKHSFKLGDSDEQHPAGSYAIETDEELLQGISFPAYRRTATWMQRVNDNNPARIMPTALVDPLQLEAALLADRIPETQQKVQS